MKTSDKPKKRRSKKPDYIIAIIINVALLYVVNNLIRWDIPYLTREFADKPLLILNISITATIIANAIFLAFDPEWFTALVRAILNLISIAFLYTFLTVFPLNIFNDSLIFWVRAVLTIGIAGLIIAFFVEFYRFIKGLTY